MDMLTKARQEAENLIQQDPTLQQPEHQQLHERVAKFWETASDIS
jgi:hypothetical protein